MKLELEQARDLPAFDSDGLMDPYLRLQCQEARLDTETFEHLGKAVHRRRRTVDPMWYFTWESDLQLPEPDMAAYFSQVC